MTDLTAEVGRPAGTLAREPRSPRLMEALVAEAPPMAEELQTNDDGRLPGWACATIITGLAAMTWAVIIFAVVALLSR